jgi:phage virion morphogenesis protein
MRRQREDEDVTGVRLDLTGADEALAFLGEAAAKAGRPRDLYDQVGAALVASTQARFEREQDPDGNPWPASLRATLEGGRTLTDTARLVSSLTHEASDAGVAVGTNVIYAAIHQLGGTIRAKTSKGLRFRSPGNGGWVTRHEVEMPRRAFLGVDEEDEQEIEFIAAAFLGAEIEGGGDVAGR